MGLIVEVIKIRWCALTDSEHEDLRDSGKLRPHFEDSDEYRYFMFAHEFGGEWLEAGWYNVDSLVHKPMGSYSKFREFRQGLAKMDYILNATLGTIYINDAMVLDGVHDHYLTKILKCKSNPLYPFMSAQDHGGVLTASECKTTLAQFKKLEGIMTNQPNKNLLKDFKKWVKLLELAVDNDKAFITFN